MPFDDTKQLFIISARFVPFRVSASKYVFFIENKTVVDLNDKFSEFIFYGKQYKCIFLIHIFDVTALFLSTW